MTDAFSQAAYGVYIIHAWVLCFVTWLAIGAIERHTGGTIQFKPGAGRSASCIGGSGQPGEHLIWIAFAVSALVTQLICWPLAYWLRKLPGLREIL